MLSESAKKALRIALGARNLSSSEAEEIISAIDSGANEQGVAVANLDQTISDPPTQAEVQAISDKMDELLASLRGSGAIAS